MARYPKSWVETVSNPPPLHQDIFRPLHSGRDGTTSHAEVFAEAKQPSLTIKLGPCDAASCVTERPTDDDRPLRRR